MAFFGSDGSTRGVGRIDDPKRETRMSEVENEQSGGRSAIWVAAGLLCLALAASAAFYFGRPSPIAPPGEIAQDPVLMMGHERFQARCASCHGPLGKGDGPIAKNQTGPPPRDFTEKEWKHGERPEDVVRVITKGVPDTGMARWDIVFNADEIRAIAAYVYLLGKRPIPVELRDPK